MITPDLIHQKLLKLWTNQKFLKACVIGEEFFPVIIPAGIVSSKHMLENFSSVQDDIRALKARSREASDAAGYEILYREIRHKKLGAQLVPAKICINTKEDFLFLIRKKKQFALFNKGFSQLIEALPELMPLIEKNPMLILKYHSVLSDLIEVCKFFKEKKCRGKYIRQLDVTGVDTKFIEAHKLILKQMLDLILPSHRINEKYSSLSNHGFEKRFNLRYDMPLVRFRLLDSDLIKKIGLQDISTTIEEFARLDLPVKKVFITENKINGLSFPTFKESMVIFGLGYGIQSLKHIGWLAEKLIFYWGDIDTHGFSILSMLRHYFPNVRSFLMDKKTLFDFRKSWVKEPADKRFTSSLSSLTDDEQSLYCDLVNNRYGDMIRLEQECISYGYLTTCLGFFCA